MHRRWQGRQEIIGAILSVRRHPGLEAQRLLHQFQVDVQHRLLALALDQFRVQQRREQKPKVLRSPAVPSGQGWQVL